MVAMADDLGLIYARKTIPHWAGPFKTNIHR
jgi:hypothetical protein